MQITIRVESTGGVRQIQIVAADNEQVGQLLTRLLMELGVPHEAALWSLLLGDRTLESTLVVSRLVVDGRPVTLVLRRTGVSAPAAPAAAAPIDSDVTIQDDEVSSDDDLAAIVEDDLDAEEPPRRGDRRRMEVDEDDLPVPREMPPQRMPAPQAAPRPGGAPKPAAPAPAALPSAAPAPAKKKVRQPAGESHQVKRQATARYYDRMNPERVYPFLVTLTAEMVKRAAPAGAAQATAGPFVADRTAAIEVEPILPGMSCHPPKAVAWLDDGDVVLKFHVVPNVLGAIEGAKVIIRQNHRVLSQIDLKMKVVKPTLAVVLGFMSFAVPFASSIVRHFAIDLQPLQDAGTNAFLYAAQFLAYGISPIFLMAVLAVLAGLSYWLTRPHQREEFWKVETVSREEVLEQIRQERTSNSAKAARDLVQLMTAHPDYQAAFLLYSQWHFEWENFPAALDGYQKAASLGRVRAADYLRGAFAASKLRLDARALEILKTAASVLPATEITGVMWYNMGCYHARLRQLDQVVPCLERAVRAGYAKKVQFLGDEDLKPVRETDGFRRLVESLA